MSRPDKREFSRLVNVFPGCYLYPPSSSSFLCISGELKKLPVDFQVFEIISKHRDGHNSSIESIINGNDGNEESTANTDNDKDERYC